MGVEDQENFPSFLVPNPEFYYHNLERFEQKVVEVGAPFKSATD
jgi:hypothetical protein